MRIEELESLYYSLSSGWSNRSETSWQVIFILPLTLHSFKLLLLYKIIESLDALEVYISKNPVKSSSQWFCQWCCGRIHFHVPYDDYQATDTLNLRSLPITACSETNECHSNYLIFWAKILLKIVETKMSMVKLDIKFLSNLFKLSKYSISNTRWISMKSSVNKSEWAFQTNSLKFIRYEVFSSKSQNSRVYSF